MCFLTFRQIFLKSSIHLLMPQKWTVKYILNAMILENAVLTQTVFSCLCNRPQVNNIRGRLYLISLKPDKFAGHRGMESSSLLPIFPCSGTRKNFTGTSIHVYRIFTQQEALFPIHYLMQSVRQIIETINSLLQVMHETIPNLYCLQCGPHLFLKVYPATDFTLP